MKEDFCVSERHACGLLQAHRSTQRYKSRKEDPIALKQRLRELAIVAVLAGPRLLDDYARAAIVEELAKRGVEAEVGAVALRGPNRVVVEALCVADLPPHDDRDIAGVDEVAVEFSRPSLFSMR